MSRTTRYLDTRDSRGIRLRVDAAPAGPVATISNGGARITVGPTEADAIVDALTRWKAAGYRPPVPARLPDDQHAALEVLAAAWTAADAADLMAEPVTVLALTPIGSGVDVIDPADLATLPADLADQAAAATITPAAAAALRARGYAAIRNTSAGVAARITLAGRHYLDLVPEEDPTP